jgi:hypothetical protein
MSDFRLSQRAVATSALALLLTGASLAPAAADGGDGKKGGKGGSSQGQQASGGKSSGKPADKPSSKPADKPSGGSGSGGGQGSGTQGSSGAKGGAAKGAGQDPAGNNGTFKVDGLAFDDGLGNEPHVSCGFRLKFYGFDEGQTGDITIAGQAPSGSGVVSQKDDVLLSDDAAGGGPNDVDAVVTYTMDDLDLSGLTAHPQQGYHVKVTLSTDTPGGVKHKVFWIEPCETETPPATGGTGTGGTDTGGTDTGTDNGTGTDVGGVDTGTGGVGVGGVGVGGVGTGTENRTGTAVLGTKFTRPQSGVAARGAQVLGTAYARGPLAFTGSFTEWLLALGAGLTAAGAGVLAFARKPRGRHAQA